MAAGFAGCEVMSGTASLKSHGWDGRRLLDAGDMYVSGNGFLVIGYPPRGRSGKMFKIGEC